MPIYEYECEICGTFEQIQGFSEKPLKQCPSCKGKGRKSKVRRLISQSAFHLKGNGWYKTDYAPSNNNTSNNNSSKDSAANSDSKKSDSKSEGEQDASMSNSTQANSTQANSIQLNSTRSKTGSVNSRETTKPPETKSCGAGCGCN